MSSLEFALAGVEESAGDSRWTTPAGVEVVRTVTRLGTATGARANLERALDLQRGLLLCHGQDRLTGFIDPPIEVVAVGGELCVRALNNRGAVLLPALRRSLEGVLAFRPGAPMTIRGTVAAPQGVFAEEDRTRHAGLFNAVRALVDGMAAPGEALLGLHGALGYDLIFQVDPIVPRLPRRPGDRDLVLYLPDTIVELDLRRDDALRYHYEFIVSGTSTGWFPGHTEAQEFTPGVPLARRDHEPGEYAAVVAEAVSLFRSGDLFEVVPTQVFRRACRRKPSELFRRLCQINPAPHALLMNLGAGEYLVGASPEMFVAVRPDPGAPGGRLVVESAPISGTIARGHDALQDAAQIKQLLNSVKEESELTMCTDVDRNDKAKVCVPGTVRVTARRRIEMYSALIHTVDRVEGLLRSDRDALDAFLAHLWAVTVTGAPKLAAVEFVERHERSPRRWYGGAVARIGFDGTLESVLTLRTIQVRDGVATVRAGATLLYDSSPEAEEAETELKARALLRVLDEPLAVTSPPVSNSAPAMGGGCGRRVLLIDHRDSFVHCLADYLRQTGAVVTTYRSGGHLAVLERERPDLVVLSPGPGRPADFDLSGTLAEAQRLGLPVFGVCLGLQGLVEYFGGKLGVLDRPVHGKASRVVLTAPGGRLLTGLPSEFDVGRYHSLHVTAAALPPQLRAVACTDDGVVMAVEHRDLPLAAVQFHPESIMTATGRVGHIVINNVVSSLARRPPGVPR